MPAVIPQPREREPLSPHCLYCGALTIDTNANARRFACWDRNTQAFQEFTDAGQSAWGRLGITAVSPCLRTPSVAAAICADIVAERGVDLRDTLIASHDPACTGTARELADMLAGVRKGGA